MKLHNIALIGLLLGSSAACAGIDKETTRTKDSDTEKFMSYSALALTNAMVCLRDLDNLNIERRPYTTSHFDIVRLINSCRKNEGVLATLAILTPAILAISDAKTAWHYFQKAFLMKNKIEQSSFTSEETTASTTKRIHTAKLIGYSVLALINIGGSIGYINHIISESKDTNSEMIFKILLRVQAFSRLALSNFYDIQEHYRKAFPSDDINKGTSHETA